MRYAIVRNSTVMNVTEGPTDGFNVPDHWAAAGLSAVASKTANIGDRYENGEFWTPEAATPEPPTVEEYAAAIEAHIDTVAQSKKYKDAASIASYVNSTNAEWAAEALTFIAWRDAVWAHVYAMMEQGETPPISDAVSLLPAIKW